MKSRERQMRRGSRPGLLIAVCVLSLWAIGFWAAAVAAESQRPEVRDAFGLGLSPDDRRDILDLAKIVSDKPVERIVVSPMLPSSTPLITVVYAEETVGTYLKDTRLTVYKKDRTRWTQAFLDSLDITQGALGTRRDLFQQEVLRVFNIEGTRLLLKQPDALSYQEIDRVLRAIKTSALVWEAKDLPADALRFSHITAVLPGSRQGAYSIHTNDFGSGLVVTAHLDGNRLVVTKVEMWVS